VRRAAVAALLLALAAPAIADEPVAPDTSAAPAADPAPAPLSKKEREFRARQDREQPPDPALEKKLTARIGRPPAEVVNVFNAWTHEDLAVPADLRALHLTEQDVDEFLRCHFTNKETDMDQALLPTAVRAAVHFHADRIVVVSGYRSPKYNLMLRKKGHQVSRKSQHKRGKALDFRIDGVTAARLRDWIRSLHMGGVGYYSQSGFVHMDTAGVRYWTGR